jgi:hypothetical protein
MNPLHILIMVILCIFIVGKVRIPHEIHVWVGTTPGIILIIGIVFYLFSVSPALGILSMIVGYEMIQPKSKKIIANKLPEEYPLTATNQFQVTLEETVVKNIVPIVQSITPSHLQFKSVLEQSHNAANVVS